ncbi:hypothetical protein [Granulicella mallensis]|uniref:Uncharacterized protein n=1 Tax=Granulicella mallensis TaxID=940614 RepID=A0A7W7ZR35_9BACT|nr:hypothetical protein [Granulicella mallensis]MBB5064539.1 hypothetical protein [Granulicella mallensis]
MIGKSGQYYRAGYLARQAGDWPDGTDNEGQETQDGTPALAQINMSVPSVVQARAVATKAATPFARASAYPTTNAVQDSVGGDLYKAVQSLSQRAQDSYHQNIDPLEQRVDNWQRGNGFRTNAQVLPPAPLAPPPRLATPGIDPRVYRASLAGYRPAGTKESVAELAGNINCETGGMRDSRNENMPLSVARGDIAHMRINGERQWGDRVKGLAGLGNCETPLMSGPDYPNALNAATDAAMEDLNGVDPTHGATNYNGRTSMGDISPFGGKNGPVIHTHAGPYISPSIYKVINTYGK